MFPVTEAKPEHERCARAACAHEGAQHLCLALESRSTSHDTASPTKVSCEVPKAPLPLPSMVSVVALLRLGLSQCLVKSIFESKWEKNRKNQDPYVCVWLAAGLRIISMAI